MPHVAYVDDSVKKSRADLVSRVIVYAGWEFEKYRYYVVNHENAHLSVCPRSPGW
ncbi:MAG: hypothetical protein GXO26_00790, partial [Crenarchaeota archaeon]|nr:hypothetical protein [Thermoproteota archaeon]